MMANDRPDLERRRKRLRYGSWHRGMREVDLVLGRFADAHLDGFDERELDQFERILTHGDPDLYAWICGRQPVPAELDNDVMTLIMNFKFAVHGTENK